MAHTAEYAMWNNMKRRCLNPQHPAWKNYGGRGVTICPEWIESFSAFYNDMGPRPDRTSLDRFPDNDGPYSKTNCRWATKSEQRINQRAPKPHTPETKLKMSLAKKGRVRPPFTAEHKAALSVAQKRRWAARHIIA